MTVAEIITSTVRRELAALTALPADLQHAALAERIASYQRDAATVADLGIDDEGIYTAIATGLPAAVNNTVAHR